MSTRPDARRRLAELMEQRRLDLGLLWQGVADAAVAAGFKLSLKTLHSVRAGTAGIRPLTQRAIEAGLQWEQGSIGRILTDGDPAPAAPAPATIAGSVTMHPPEITADPAPESAEDIAAITDAVVTVLAARRGVPGVWAELRDYLAGAGLFDDDTELGAWPPGEIPAELTPRAEQALDAAARAGVLFRDEIGTIAARMPYDWDLRVRMIAGMREEKRKAARNPTRARRAG